MQVNGNATVTGNVVTNNVSPQSGNTVQINGGISTTGSVIAQGSVVASSISTLSSALSLSGTGINLTAQGGSVTVDTGSTLRVDAIAQSTSTSQLLISTSNNQNIALLPSSAQVNVTGSVTASRNIAALGNLSVVGNVTSNLKISSAYGLYTDTIDSISGGDITMVHPVRIGTNLYVSTIYGIGAFLSINTRAICNEGVTFGNGSSTINWYEEASLTGTWSNTAEGTSTTFKLCRIGSMVFINVNSYSNITPSGSVTNLPRFSASMPAQFRPAVDFYYRVVPLLQFVIQATGSVYLLTADFNQTTVFTVSTSYSVV